MLITILVLTFLIFTSIPTHACQCPKGTYKFIKRLKKAEFVGYIEVIGHDTTKSQDFDQTFTIFKIIKQFQGKYIGQTISVLDGGDVGCTHNLSHPIGTRFIIKARIESRKEHEFNWEDTPLPLTNAEIRDPILVVSICAENVINVKDEKAIGYITTDRMKTKQHQIFDIQEAILIIKKKTKHEKELPLTMPTQKQGHEP